jgi:hypothetical protein
MPIFQFGIPFNYMKEIYDSVGIAVLCWYCANKSTHMIMTIRGHSSAAIWKDKGTQKANHFVECLEFYYCLPFSSYLMETKEHDMWACWKIC